MTRKTYMEEIEPDAGEEEEEEEEEEEGVSWRGKTEAPSMRSQRSSAAGFPRRETQVNSTCKEERTKQQRQIENSKREKDERQREGKGGGKGEGGDGREAEREEKERER